MSTVLRLLLMISAVCMAVFVYKGVKKAKLRAQETFFWFFLSLLFILLSAFPGIAEWTAGLLGIISPVNLVFLLIIFMLLIKVFMMERRAAETEHQLTQMIKHLAIDDLNRREIQEKEETT